MATNESDFKREFREALGKNSPQGTLIWTNNDMFRSGLPDFSVLRGGRFFAIEAKFVKAPPARPSSKVLDHELSAGQAQFLRKTHESGGYGIVLIGFNDVAVAVPIWEWSPVDQLPAANITLERVRLMGKGGLSFPKKSGKWDVTNFFHSIEASRGHDHVQRA